ncbi:MAG: hypothetical protein K8F92_06025 [Hyphomicrobium sp.]|uniref:hypothetical protein n=1 Tax=Hyphomicrobium sp. TaxID=82 RepID=UPI001329081F|nr:hypothetical protein [Hyphomicrobium sp.]KAB2943179.1 MAG: hypothetical protein F9K20_03970 [Hyphomicrobium sp.]MBZ0209193.1 hypothetical protein [Hyphomicrobium sp.]MCZ7594130.1 hypothetical protein [Hyphomicrobium sp.]
MPASRKGDSGEQPLVSGHEIRELAGPVADHTIVAILETGASLSDLEIALIYARGEGDYVDRLGHPLSGRVAQICDILAKDELFAINEER